MNARGENKGRKKNNSSQEKLNSFQSKNCEKPPIFTGFELLEENENGFFIRNSKDNSIFKWIDVTKLQKNGIFYRAKTYNKGGRRNFHGLFWDCFKQDTYHEIGYYETDDALFKKCIKEFGGFYVAISRARKDSLGYINFANTGSLVNFIDLNDAKKSASNYAVQFAPNNEFISCLPCGASMDCMYEEIYERFRKEVRLVKKDDELEYDAWNRYESQRRKYFKDCGIYGIWDLFFGYEYTTEFYNNPSMVAIRGGLAHGLYLVSGRENEKLKMTASFPLGHRNFTSSDVKFDNLGYRVILLPKRI